MKPIYEELEVRSDAQSARMVGANKINMAIASWNKRVGESAQ
ncbi:hypothetical protein ACNH6Y_001866 [Escherichia coli]